MKGKLAIFVAFWVAMGCMPCAHADDTAVVIRAGHLIDTQQGRVLGPQMILVRDGRIAEVGPQIAVPAGASVVDLGGYTVLPGLIDAHTHLTIDQVDQDQLAEL
jgi:imidazolonepropionase-like amidohydrolase